MLPFAALLNDAVIVCGRAHLCCVPTGRWEKRAAAVASNLCLGVGGEVSILSSPPSPCPVVDARICASQ